jgi:serine/threonine-protein kinase RsbW
MVRGKTIRATIPGSLEYRDLAVRLIASSCKLVPRGAENFSNEVVSAFGEALNNVVIHGHLAPGSEIEIEVEPSDEGITIRLRDYGVSFDPSTTPDPDFDTLPESGMGTYILRSFMDEIDYEGGVPNTLTMKKRTPGGSPQ